VPVGDLNIGRREVRILAQKKPAVKKKTKKQVVVTGKKGKK
jgi:hypothetical protein